MSDRTSKHVLDLRVKPEELLEASQVRRVSQIRKAPETPDAGDSLVMQKKYFPSEQFLQRETRVFEKPKKVFSQSMRKLEWHTPERLRKKAHKGPNLLRDTSKGEITYYRDEKISISRHFEIPTGWKLQVAWFVIGAIAIVIPVQAFNVYQNVQSGKTDVTALSTRGLTNLESAGENLKLLDFASAGRAFISAREDFISAQTRLDELKGWVPGIARAIPQATLAEKLVMLGQTAAEAGHFMTQGMQLFSGFGVGHILSATSTPELKEPKLSILSGSLALSDQRIATVGSILNSIEVSDLPEDYQEKFGVLKEKFPDIQESVHAVHSFVQYFADLLGHDGSKRYLVVFQNNAELRPTGGFMGSLAVVDVSGGAITKLDVPGGGPYDFQGSLTAQVVAPEPLWLVQPEWQFQDANWWPDFPSSAKKIMWFYEYSGGSTVDGVIALQPQLVEDLLAAVGPVTLPEYGLTIDAENFRELTQTQVELNYNKTENKPKQFIGDLIPLLLDRLLTSTPDQLVQLLATFEKNLADKSVLFYFTDPAFQQKTSEFGWAGEMRSTGRDFLTVSEANIGGGKTDLVIDRTIDLTVHVGDDGTVINTVRLRRTHNGTRDDVFTGLTNNAFVRMYVPVGSKLTGATGFGGPAPEHFKFPPEGFKIDDDYARIHGAERNIPELELSVSYEFGKTVFSGWHVLDVGETGAVEVSYELPWKLGKDSKDFLEQGLTRLGLVEQSAVWSLLAQKQPGVRNEKIRVRLELPQSWDVAAYVPDGATFERAENVITWESDLEFDRGFGAVLTKE